MACGHGPGRQSCVSSLIFSLISSQPIIALEHPKFKELIDVASRATNGVKIPNRRRTRDEIIRLFKDHLTKLKAELNVNLFLTSCFFSHDFTGPSCSRRSQSNV